MKWVFSDYDFPVCLAFIFSAPNAVLTGLNSHFQGAVFVGDCIAPLFYSSIPPPLVFLSSLRTHMSSLLAEKEVGNYFWHSYGIILGVLIFLEQS